MLQRQLHVTLKPISPALADCASSSAALCEQISAKMKAAISQCTGIPLGGTPGFEGGAEHRLSKAWMTEELRRIFLTAALPRRQLEPGEILIKEGVESKAMYLVVSGRLVLSKESGSGRTLTRRGPRSRGNHCREESGTQTRDWPRGGADTATAKQAADDDVGGGLMFRLD